jgi:DNA-directed RNA polymerase subunit RPC12/RpoP
MAIPSHLPLATWCVTDHIGMLTGQMAPAEASYLCSHCSVPVSFSLTNEMCSTCRSCRLLRQRTDTEVVDAQDVYNKTSRQQYQRIQANQVLHNSDGDTGDQPDILFATIRALLRNQISANDPVAGDELACWLRL